MGDMPDWAVVPPLLLAFAAVLKLFLDLRKSNQAQTLALEEIERLRLERAEEVQMKRLEMTLAPSREAMDDIAQTAKDARELSRALGELQGRLEVVQSQNDILRGEVERLLAAYQRQAARADKHKARAERLALSLREVDARAKTLGLVTLEEISGLDYADDAPSNM